MKKFLAFALAITLFFTACGGSTAAPAADPGASDSSAASDSAAAPAAPADDGADAAAPKRIALVCDEAGTQVFVLMMIEGLREAAAQFGFEPIIVECADSAAYEDNIRALVQEQTDLIIVGGWIGGDALNKIAQEFPDSAHYALIDSTVEAENVKCIAYREQEGAYLIGMIASSMVDAGQEVFGAVHVNQGPGSWKWRYGFMEGVKTGHPGASFVFNYVGGYNDPVKAKEFAILQYEQGARFINAACAGGDVGVFEAALERSFYTSGQDVDLTNPNNPYIVSSQIKDTKGTVKYLLEQYFTTEWTHDNEVWGISEGTIGAVHITHDSPNPIHERLSGDVLANIKQAADDIRTGKLNLTDMPAEEDY
ncbi:MAG: BMP family ABC transporter substrate-binding protein [Oscillospiraceae bacterium]|nr:BMP family ABC transporter substrate-binding protein [Oscillospiraceae bacterium]